jgi:hypothetical protein
MIPHKKMGPLTRPRPKEFLMSSDVHDAETPGKRLVCIDWKPCERGTLLGFATIKMPSGLAIGGVALHAKGEAKWAQLPSKPMLDQDTRQLMHGPDGKVKYAKVLWFDDHAVGDRFSAAVIEAIARFTH